MGLETCYEWNSVNWRACVVLLILGGLVVAPMRVNAQSNTITIHLDDPSENQTFYFGPSTLLYSIPIKGWVPNNLSLPSL